MPRIFVLNVPENQGVLEVITQDAALTVDHLGPYARVSAPEPIVIDRRATGCRHAVWYSAVAGIENSVIAQHDKDALRVEER